MLLAPGSRLDLEPWRKGDLLRVDRGPDDGHPRDDNRRDIDHRSASGPLPVPVRLNSVTNQ